MLGENHSLTDKQALFLRLFVGASFGLLIAFLSKFALHGGVERDGQVWREVLAVTLALVAFPIWAGAGSMRRRTLAIWTLVAFVIVGFIHWSASNINGFKFFNFGGHALLIFPFLFIAHELVSSGDQAGRLIAPYETYFDEAWKRGVQLGLAILFTLLFWGILALGAALLGFIGFSWLQNLLSNEYFSWPMTGVAFGTAVHLGDIQNKLLSNVRNLILGVLSWLLPIITLIGAIFAVSLLRSGLAPLWDTKAATASLLAGCVGFVLLINTAYQQGDIDRPVSIILKWCVRLAAVLLFVFALLAAWSLWLRIDQYGLSSDRIMAGVGVIIALAFGIGYTVAALLPGRWMAMVERVNIAMAVTKVAIFFAILTPIAAPARLSTNDQVARLNSGKVSVADFDWWLLKDETGHYGKHALEALAKSNTLEIAVKAKAALNDDIGDRPYRHLVEPDRTARPPQDFSKLKVVFPEGGTLPQSFTAPAANADRIDLPDYCFEPPSLHNNSLNCSAAMIDLNNDQQVEVIIRNSFSVQGYHWTQGKWEALNVLVTGKSIIIADFDAGLIRAEPRAWKDLAIGPVGQRAIRLSVRAIDVDPVATATATATPSPPSK